MIFKYIICLLVGYIFGCLQTGYFYGKMKGIDIREHGSGNAGTTNTLRPLGRKAGIITYCGDAIKALLAIWVIKYVIFNTSDGMEILKMYTGLGVVLGHNYPFYLNFRGGKGIAATSAVMVAVDIRFLIPGLILFFGAFAITRYVSVGSLLISAMFPILICILYPGHWHMIILSCIFCAMAYWRHRENIKRLIRGTENRIERK